MKIFFVFNFKKFCLKKIYEGLHSCQKESTYAQYAPRYSIPYEELQFCAKNEVNPGNRFRICKIFSYVERNWPP